MISDDDLIQAWHSETLADDLADSMGISRSQLIVAWRRLKLQGLLPSGDRPRSANNPDRQINQSDGRSSVLDLRGKDALLDALQRGRR
jgi:hypothetical protein